MPSNILIITADEGKQILLKNALQKASLNVQKITIISNKTQCTDEVKKEQHKIVFFDEALDDENKIFFLDICTCKKSASIIILSSEERSISSLSYIPLGAIDIILENNITVFTVEKSIKQALKQKQTESSLQFSNERYMLVSKTTSDMVWDWDLQNNKLFRSETGWKKILGTHGIFELIDPIEIVDPDSWRDRIHVADRAVCDKTITNILENQSENTFELEYRIRKNDNTYAIILDKGYVIRNEIGEATRLVGAATDYTERRLLELKIETERSQRQNEITSAVITAQEHERAEIGKELHDNINQLLASSKLYIEFSLTSKPLNTELLINAKTFIETAIAEIRLLTKALMPPTVGKDGLTTALIELIDTLKKINVFTIHTNWQYINETKINEPLKLTIFRIIQEQLNNIIKHAKATEVWILVEQTDKQIIITVKDNGEGFDTKIQKEGVGIKNINSRTHLHNGIVKLASQINKGCTLTVQFKL